MRKRCPECNELVNFNTYFGGYICGKCEWEDRSFNDKRRAKFIHMVNLVAKQ
jgi:hypothetical protein